MPDDKQEKPIILLVDDEPHNLTVFKGTFRRYYNVLVAPSVDEAMSLLQQHSIQVIITDQRMPDITGVEFLSKIVHQYPEAIRMVLTGYSDIEAVISAINEGGVFQFLTKPWSEGSLKLAIDNAVDYYNLQQENKELLEHLSGYNKRLEQEVQQRTQELQQANAELRRLNEQLQILNQRKNEFMEIAAHDLKNPLNGIMGIASMIETVPDLPRDKVEEGARMIVSSSQRMVDLIMRLLSGNAAEQNSLLLHPMEFNAVELIQRILEIHRQWAEAKQVQIHFNGDAEPLLLVSDKALIAQVVENIISNALKFSPYNKNIWINVAILEELPAEQVEQPHSGNDRDWLSAKPYLSVVVRDEGPGISAQDQKKLFTRYTRLSAQPTAGENSSGLGLSIVKHLIEVLQGTIRCDSALNAGATFTVLIPSLYPTAGNTRESLFMMPD